MAVVFKYRKADSRAIDILRRRRLWLSAPADFNDPSDMRLPIKGLFDSSYDVTFRKMVRISLDQDPSQRPVDVLKDTSVALQEGGLHAGLRDGIGAKLFDEVRQEAGVISFGATNNNDHLWREYADAERGVCIGFDTQILGLKAHPVNYIKEGQEPALRFFESTGRDIRAAACLVKYAKWQAEDEVRIIIPKHARTFFSFRKEVVVSVTFGASTAEDFKVQIRRIVTERYPHASHCIDR